MSEMIERVARIICAKSYEDPNVYWGTEPISVAVDKDWHLYEDEARAVIEAMREPTEAMMRHWDSVTNQFGIYEEEGRAVYQAMIDEALK